MGMEPEEVVRFREETEVEEEEKVEEVTNLKGREFKEERGKVKLARLVCTTIKTNCRVSLPTHRPIKEECNLGVLVPTAA